MLIYVYLNCKVIDFSFIFCSGEQSGIKQSHRTMLIYAISVPVLLIATIIVVLSCRYLYREGVLLKWKQKIFCRSDDRNDRRMEEAEEGTELSEYTMLCMVIL